jgi:hypothetical protein
VALRAGASVLVPLLVLWALGRTEWTIYAAFGAFTSLYGRNHAGLTRARMQVNLGVLLTLATAGGVLVGLTDQRAWVAVPTTALVATIGSLASDAQDWHPPGPLFLVFAFAACASIPSRPGDVVVAFDVAGATALLAVVIGNAGTWWRGGHEDTASWPRASYAEVARRHVLRNGLAVAAAGTIATAAGIGHPYWAMVSAVVPLAARDLSAQVVRGVHRLVGTALGLVLAGVLLAVDPPAPALIGVVTVLQVAAELLVGRNYAVALVAVTPLALLMVHLAAPTPPGVLLADRGVETLIGVVVGLAVGYLTRPRPRAAVDMSA